MAGGGGGGECRGRESLLVAGGGGGGKCRGRQVEGLGKVAVRDIRQMPKTIWKLDLHLQIP